MKINRFEEIEAWITARELTRMVYGFTSLGNFARDFGLRDQIQRASVSIMSNIAEGFESSSRPGFIRYLGIAKASAGEVRCQLYVALDCGYLTREEFEIAWDRVDKCSRQLSNFITYLRGKRSN